MVRRASLKGGKLKQLSHRAVQRRPRWTREEIATLKRLYRSRSNAEIATVLGRTVSSIVFKGYRLGLAKGARRLKEMGRENINKRWHSR